MHYPFIAIILYFAMPLSVFEPVARDRLLFHNVIDGIKYFLIILVVLIEHNHANFGITPCRIGKQLQKGVSESPCTFPYFTFGYICSVFFGQYLNVRLSVLSESLSTGPVFVMRVQCA